MTSPDDVGATALEIEPGEAVLQGDLVVPPSPGGLVIFAHGSGSSRFSERNRSVARVLQRAGLATLLLDLLTRDEEAVDMYTREYRFDIERLARRVVAAVDWGAHDVDAGSMFYYFRPEASGCQLAAGDVHAVTATLTPSNAEGLSDLWTLPVDG